MRFLQVSELNLYKEADLTPYNQVLEDCHVRQCWRDLMQRGSYETRCAQVNKFNRYYTYHICQHYRLRMENTDFSFSPAFPLFGRYIVLKIHGMHILLIWSQVISHFLVHTFTVNENRSSKWRPVKITC